MERSVRGLKYAPLSNAGRFFNLQPLRVKVSPLRRGHEHFHHDGEEWIYVLSGSLTLSLSGKTYDLEAGDAAHFESRLPHRLMARGDRDAEVLVVAAPVWSPPANPNFTPRRAIPAMGLLPLQPGRTSNLVSSQRRLAQGGARRRWDASHRRLK